ncbi:uncharacterized protein EV420DRAFT_1485702 [Desarmillaria tabescens]|uniref:F-box domain-containing protein n=1 Tax=Armillaria tabescens TaxID=1929756 RepID=A0AA39MP94_ARMTA|nr:uncharacterized protein EV420DRAFT_1485702 [Desarmillaria tabescens]KAK0441243.1 hypothetical protein EV420DRAFT_1485702 [Desarmillaria tabescens]
MNNMLEGLCSRCKDLTLFPKEPLTSTIPSSLAGLLRTNTAPPESEVENLKISREHIRHSITELDNQIHNLTFTLEKLRVEHARLQGFDDEYAALLSPIRRIPSKILSEIFFHTQEEYHQVFVVSSPSWMLSWVCKSWQMVVVNCSEFWCNLDVHSPKATEKATSLLRTAISRAKERKLVLSLRFSSGSDSDVISLLDILMESSDRWFAVDLELPAGFFPNLAPIRGRLDSLERLSLDFQGNMSLDGHIDAFEVVPRLKSVTILGIENMMIPLPPSHLSDFHNDRLFGDDALNAYFLDIIRNAPHLHRFRVGHQNTAIDGAFGVTPRFLHPNIHVLHACEGSFLRSLILPQLEHMSLETSAWNLPCPPNSLLGLHDLLQHSCCSLRSLHIVNLWPLEAILLDILQLTPHLEDFHFSIDGWEDDSNTVMQTIISHMSDKDEYHRLRLILS